MSKKFQKEKNRQINSDSVKTKSNLVKTPLNTQQELIKIGNVNVKRWNLIKSAFQCETDESFTVKLLDLAQDYLNKNSVNTNENNDLTERNNGKSKRKKIESKKEKKEIDTVKPPVGELNETKEEPQSQMAVEKIIEDVNLVAKPKDKDEKNRKKSPDLKKREKESKKRIEHDIRKAPELKIQTDNKLEPKPEENDSANRVAIKIKMCQNCGTRHIQDHCPLNYPNFTIHDSLTITEWSEKYQVLYSTENDRLKSDKENDQSTTQIECNKFAFAKVSLPNFLQLIETNSDHGLGVWTKVDIQEFTQFGPLIGKIVKEVDISEDSTMRDLWEISGEGGNIYFNTEDVAGSNWMRFVRPATSRDDRNLTIINKQGSLYFVSTKMVQSGEELVYWQDSAVATNKKKMEKTSCGGCNMTFAHPLYYRIHCSVFHDIRYSLTIRKYHCKVCGAAVLGKENIMKHAAELHNGQGAYQCQFCKKFFLRLNYLEMHRTYGCSANPHRARPLCDFCGRKFCQPQKLKVHIKRMHSDFSEVLKEFQCKSCLKILGSRAALQRHLKEVHQKQMDGACSCSRCGKHFQNKSNLKIHMLTHSGIKPFKCVIKSCNAAFTTKQCLQFHYKKVHSFNEEVMPKIERSIDYTFEAYSGLEETEDQQQQDKKEEGEENLEKNDARIEQEESESENEAEEETSMDSRTLDDPSAHPSDSPQPNPPSPDPPEKYTMKILSKGSKKWIGDDHQQQSLPPTLKPEIYPPQIEHRLPKDDLTDQSYDRKIPSNNLQDFNRHEASNASLLVEAALDSVCSEPNIDIDVSSTPSCGDALNLYTLATPSDSLADVTYSETVCNDHISVTDELGDELRHNQNMGMDYSGFHQEDFSPGNSPDMHHRTSFVRNYINTLSPQNYQQQKSPGQVPSPPRYDFGHATAEHLSSDDSNGLAQNLSVNKNNMQLDLSIYRRNSDVDKKIYGIDQQKSYVEEETNVLDGDQVDSINSIVDMKEKDPENDRNKYPDDLSTDIRNKFDLDLDLRLKNYEVESGEIRSRLYEPTELDFRNKNYDLIDNLERKGATGAPYETLETDFRPDRNFEPLVLNSELQGLDMSARSFHNYSNINRYHHLYPEVDRVDLRLNYSPPAPTYSHADILRVVSLDLTPPGRHSVDLSLRSHPLHQIANSRLLSEHVVQPPHRLLDQGRLLSSDLSGRILSDHTTNRILGNSDQLSGGNHLLGDQRMLGDDSSRIIPSGSVSPIPFSGYSVSQSPYHPTPLPPRPHVTSPTPTPYHHYSSYY